VAKICEEIQEWVEEEVLEPIERRKTGTREKCKKRKCKKWCLCCNKWKCWIETFVYWVTEWVVRIVGKWTTRIVCETIHVGWRGLVIAGVVALGTLLILQILIAGAAMSFTEDGLPVWGNYCGPGHGDDPQNKDAIDAVDEACKKHDACYSDNYFGCDCDLQLLADLPGAITTEAEKGNVAAVAAGEAVLAYFSSQTPITCTVDAGKTVGGWIEDGVGTVSSWF
jgi:hypothetical protein